MSYCNQLMRGWQQYKICFYSIPLFVMQSPNHIVADNRGISYRWEECHCPKALWPRDFRFRVALRDFQKRCRATKPLTRCRQRFASQKPNVIRTTKAKPRGTRGVAVDLRGDAPPESGSAASRNRSCESSWRRVDREASTETPTETMRGRTHDRLAVFFIAAHCRPRDLHLPGPL